MCITVLLLLLLQVQDKFNEGYEEARAGGSQGGSA